LVLGANTSCHPCLEEAKGHKSEENMCLEYVTRALEGSCAVVAQFVEVVTAYSTQWPRKVDQMQNTLSLS
jgi:hypothetical protein